MRSARRSTKVHGMVNFPVHTPNSGEGGMFVRLWALAPKGAGLCCGTETTELVDSCFLGTDTTKDQIIANALRMEEEWNKPITSAQQVTRLDKLQKRLDHKTTKDLFYYTQEDHVPRRWSCGLAASVLMGSTGWSNSSFICTYEDLNGMGKQFYDLFKSQYPHCKLHLLTFLDT